MKLGPPRSSAAGASISFGDHQGPAWASQISVGLDAGRLMLQVGRQQESVVRILRWIDDRAVRRHGPYSASRQPQGAGTAVGGTIPAGPQQAAGAGRARRRLETKQSCERRKKRRADTGESWTTIATAIAATDFPKTGDRRAVSAATVRRIITEMLRRERENSRSKRKERR